MIGDSIASLFQQLTPDAWRKQVGFSPDMEALNRILFNPNTAESDAIDGLSAWLQKNQPCVFGKMAAKFGFISYCLLSESDLMMTDEKIRDKIQASRLLWLKEGFEGKKSNFIILVVSPALSYAVPDQVVARIAQRLCSLYLGRDIDFDFVHHEEIFLEKPGSARMTWKWLAGVNYFSAQGDKRWWNDHRIPGGMGFSVNSVGHLVKSEKVARSMIQLNQDLGIADEEGWDDSKVDSLEKALMLAMQTISQASDSISGKATKLLPLSHATGDEGRPTCPIALPSSLADKDYCSYAGYYHTDYTLPSEYFVSEVVRPASVEPFLLDFTYLFHKHVDNPDHWTMGEGRRVRADGTSQSEELNDEDDNYKQHRGRPQSVELSSCDLLMRALAVNDATSGERP
jgi:hypothetical protein